MSMSSIGLTDVKGDFFEQKKNPLPASSAYQTLDQPSITPGLVSSINEDMEEKVESVHIPYSRKYLQRDGTSNDFLKSVSYSIKLRGKLRLSSW